MQINNKPPYLKDAHPKGIMHRLTSPLQEEFRVGDFATNRIIFPIVPFLDFGDATLRVLRDLSELSPTQAACVNSQVGYATAAGLGLRHKQGAVKRQSNTERLITDAQHDEYVGFLEENFDLDVLLRKINRTLRNLKTYGNAVLEVVLTQTGRVRNVAVNIYDADMFRYRIPADAPNAAGASTLGDSTYFGSNIHPVENLRAMGVQTGFIAARWSPSFLSSNLSRVVEYPVYSPQQFAQGQPYFAEYSDGTYRCLMHIKDDAIDREYYGLPSSISGIYYQFMEFQSGKYATRGYENQWLPSLIMDIEEPQQLLDEEDSNELMLQTLNQLANTYTNRSDEAKLPVVVRLRGIGTAPASITQIQSRPDKGFHPEFASLAQGEILKANQWHSSLLEKTVGSIGNSSEHRDLARITDATVIRPLQELALMPFRWAIEQAQQWVGYSNPARHELDLKSIFESDAALATVPPVQTPV